MFNASIRTTPQGWSVVLPTSGYTLNLSHVKEGFQITGTRSTRRGNGSLLEGKSRSNGHSTRAVTPKVSTARRAQGLYLNAIRPLTKADRRQVRKIREEKGVREAIRQAKRMAS